LGKFPHNFCSSKTVTLLYYNTIAFTLLLGIALKIISKNGFLKYFNVREYPKTTLNTVFPNKSVGSVYYSFSDKIHYAEHHSM